MTVMPDLICLSHLRWDFVYQRPQHLLSRFAKERRVFFIEEPIYDADVARTDVSLRQDSLWVVVPHLPAGTPRERQSALMRDLLQALLATHELDEYILWYYTPMALDFTASLDPAAVVYDCMDELGSFKGAPPELREHEDALFRMADVVFTGGQSLFEAKRDRHANVHAFPSSIDMDHFALARGEQSDPPDQASIPSPRLGFAGVIDERMDLELIAAVADARPEWHIVMIGPVVKIDIVTLPQRSNIHYLGQRSYADLPAFIAGWDVALIPFALNDSTRFISPTKTPEYLAAGKPVVSTAIRDVVRPYGEAGLVHIARSPDEFIASVENALSVRAEKADNWLRSVDALLGRTSWDATWKAMGELIDHAVSGRKGRHGTVESKTPAAMPV